jgi:hypothetical protein
MTNHLALTEQPIGLLTRELDRRRSNGIEVALLWNPRTDQLHVAVVDEHRGEALEFEVAGRDALKAFYHPYAFAPPSDGDTALAA